MTALSGMRRHAESGALVFDPGTLDATSVLVHRMMDLEKVLARIEQRLEQIESMLVSMKETP